MNGDKDGLADIGKFPEKSHRVERGLTVQSGSWFVEEDKDRRFRYELNANRHSLALLNGKTRPKPANQRVLEVVEFEKVDDGINVCQLLLSRCVPTLTKQSRKLESLSHGAERFVDIKLLAVSSRSLERNGKWTTIDQNLTVDSSFGFPLS